VVCFYVGPADKPGRQAWLEEFTAALRQGDDGAYTGFLGEDGPARVHQAYRGRPGTGWSRSRPATTPPTCSATTTTSRQRAEVRAYDVALFVDLLVVEPAGTPNTGDLSDSDRTTAAQWI
jgi:hypothetical protein